MDIMEKIMLNLVAARYWWDNFSYKYPVYAGLVTFALICILPISRDS